EQGVVRCVNLRTNASSAVTPVTIWVKAQYANAGTIGQVSAGTYYVDGTTPCPETGDLPSGVPSTAVQVCGGCTEPVRTGTDAAGTVGVYYKSPTAANFPTSGQDILTAMVKSSSPTISDFDYYDWVNPKT